METKLKWVIFIVILLIYSRQAYCESQLSSCIAFFAKIDQFHCQVGKSYYAGHDKIPHQNAILDSIIDQNVWFGGYSGAANVLLDDKM